jgi:hypothetical protein
MFIVVYYPICKLICFVSTHNLYYDFQIVEEALTILLAKFVPHNVILDLAQLPLTAPNSYSAINNDLHGLHAFPVFSPLEENAEAEVQAPAEVKHFRIGFGVRRPALNKKAPLGAFLTAWALAYELNDFVANSRGSSSLIFSAADLELIKEVCFVLSHSSEFCLYPHYIYVRVIMNILASYVTLWIFTPKC